MAHSQYPPVSPIPTNRRERRDNEIDIVLFSRNKDLVDENPATIHIPSRQFEGETELLSAGAAPGGGEQAGVVDV